MNSAGHGYPLRSAARSDARWRVDAEASDRQLVSDARNRMDRRPSERWPLAAAPADVAWAPAAVLRSCGNAVAQVHGAGVSSIGVTSAATREGRTTIAIGTALVERNDFGRRTVLVELDLERPTLASRLGMSPHPGVAEALRREAKVADCISWIDDHLGVMVAGQHDGDAARLIAGLRDAPLLAEVAKQCDIVVGDLPCLPPDGLGDRVAGEFDAVMLVVAAGSTPLSVVRRGVAHLERSPYVVLNRTKSAVPRWLQRRVGL